jgi:hypothetical protein
MKTFENDKELKMFLKNVKLESPGKDFSSQVMNRIFQEESVVEQVKAEPILGRGFWIILALFVILMAVMVYLSAGSTAAGSTSGMLPDIDSTNFMAGYRSFFEKLDVLPASIAGIFIGASLLVFLEKYLESKKLIVS